MSVETVTCTVLRQGLTYGTFWPGALAQQDMLERRTENLFYGNTYYLLYDTNHKSYISEEKNNLLYGTIYCTVRTASAQITKKLHSWEKNKHAKNLNSWCYRAPMSFT